MCIARIKNRIKIRLQTNKQTNNWCIYARAYRKVPFLININQHIYEQYNKHSTAGNTQKLNSNTIIRSKHWHHYILTYSPVFSGFLSRYLLLYKPLQRVQRSVHWCRSWCDSHVDFNCICSGIGIRYAVILTLCFIMYVTGTLVFIRIELWRR